MAIGGVKRSKKKILLALTLVYTLITIAATTKKILKLFFKLICKKDERRTPLFIYF